MMRGWRRLFEEEFGGGGGLAAEVEAGGSGVGYRAALEVEVLGGRVGIGGEGVSGDAVDAGIVGCKGG
jgi:hypothetical protein